MQAYARNFICRQHYLPPDSITDLFLKKLNQLHNLPEPPFGSGDKMMQSLWIRFLKFRCHHLTITTLAKQQTLQINQRVGSYVAGEIDK